MSERQTIIPNNFKEAVVLGAANEKSKVEMISKIGTQIIDGNIFDTANENRNTEATGILRSLNEGYDSYQKIQDTLNNPTATDKQKELAKTNKDVLVKATFLSIVQGENDELKNALISKQDLNEALPESFRGMEDDLRAHVISDEKVIGALDKLDKAKKLYGDKNKDKLNERIEGIVTELAESIIDSDIDPDEYHDYTLAFGYLSGELQANEPQKAVNRTFSEEDMDEEELAAERMARTMMVTKGEDGQDVFEGGYGPDWDEFTRNIFYGADSSLRANMPPTWYKNFKKEPNGKPGRFGKEQGGLEQWKYRIIADISRQAGSKLMLKDGDLGTLAEKARPALAMEEFKLLYEVNESGSGLKGFKESMEVYTKELFNFNYETGFLELKKRSYTDDNGVEKDLYANFFGYQEYLVDHLMNGTGPFTGKKVEGLNSKNDAKIALGTAWNFLFIGDVVESADEKRVLNPGKSYGDKVAAMFHPEAKFLRKMRLRFPGAGSSGREFFKGDEEPFGGTYGDWWYNKMSIDKNVFNAVNSESVTPFPKRLAMSFPESFPVIAFKNNNGEIEDISMAQALYEGKTIVTNIDQAKNKIISNTGKPVDDFRINYDADAPMFIRYRDIYQASFALFNMCMGKAPLDEKNPRKWGEDFRTNTALIRQNPIPTVGKYLDYVNSVDFLKVAISNSVGVNPNWTTGLFLAPYTGDADVYATSVSALLNSPGLIEVGDSKTREGIIKELKSEFMAKSILGSVVEIRKAQNEFRKNNRSRLI